MNPTTWLQNVKDQMKDLKREKERHRTNGGVEDIKNINAIINHLDQLINRYKM